MKSELRRPCVAGGLCLGEKDSIQQSYPAQKPSTERGHSLVFWLVYLIGQVVPCAELPPDLLSMVAPEGGGAHVSLSGLVQSLVPLLHWWLACARGVITGAAVPIYQSGALYCISMGRITLADATQPERHCRIVPGTVCGVTKQYCGTYV